MPELRWILLIVGALFLGGLALWELRRKRRLPPRTVEESTQHRFREPTLGLPELRPREAPEELPVFEVDESMIGLRVDGIRIEEDMGSVLAQAAGEPPIVQPRRVDAESSHPDVDAPPAGVELAHASADPHHPGESRGSSEIELPSADVPDFLREGEQPSGPIVEWPPEEERRLLAIKVAAPAGEKFSGRALRLAFLAEGFALGKFSIFHKPGNDGRAIVSAASAKQPGSFDLSSMDTQRYGGIGLFAVLPGPLPDNVLLEELLIAGRSLCERLQGNLQTERGEPLDATHIAEMRAGLESRAAS